VDRLAPRRGRRLSAAGSEQTTLPCRHTGEFDCALATPRTCHRYDSPATESQLAPRTIRRSVDGTEVQSARSDPTHDCVLGCLRGARRYGYGSGACNREIRCGSGTGRAFRSRKSHLQGIFDPARRRAWRRRAIGGRSAVWSRHQPGWVIRRRVVAEHLPRPGLASCVLRGAGRPFWLANRPRAPAPSPLQIHRRRSDLGSRCDRQPRARRREGQRPSLDACGSRRRVAEWATRRVRSHAPTRLSPGEARDGVVTRRLPAGS
jgi:hypothetical protein